MLFISDQNPVLNEQKSDIELYFFSSLFKMVVVFSPSVSDLKCFLFLTHWNKVLACTAKLDQIPIAVKKLLLLQLSPLSLTSRRFLFDNMILMFVCKPFKAMCFGEQFRNLLQ